MGASVELLLVDCLLEAWFAPFLGGRAKRASPSQTARHMMSLSLGLVIFAITSAVMIRIASASAPMIMPTRVATRVSMGMWRAGTPACLCVLVDIMCIHMDSVFTVVHVDVIPLAMCRP